MSAAPYRISYISVPESLRHSFDDAPGSFSLDPSIPIPVELPDGEEKLDLEKLSWEMIISGMLRVITAEREAEDADYYRRFILTVKPDIKTEFTEAAIFKAKNREFKLALEILDAVSSLYPDDPVTALNQARVWEEYSADNESAGRLETAESAAAEAEAAYRRSMSASANYPDAYFNAAYFYMGRHNFTEAVSCLRRYTEISDDERKKAKANAAIKHIEASNLDDARFHEAYEAIKAGDADGAMEKIRGFLERRPDVWNAWFILGWALRRSERWAEAAQVFRKALELGGDAADLRNELAICLMETGELDEARGQLEKALYADGENLKIISNLGVIALRQGRQAEAAGFFRTVLEYDPEDPLAKAMLAKLADPDAGGA